ncbi:hypothetical protein V6N13_134229 [Hibiscus sabdariffa]|uniref:Uncharacterized protein n=1 Tax=Hibiscus sabdariffa TaxID=183260 RepID=A0ABR2R384_9ROSI
MGFRGVGVGEMLRIVVCIGSHFHGWNEHVGGRLHGYRQIQWFHSLRVYHFCNNGEDFRSFRDAHQDLSCGRSIEHRQQVCGRCLNRRHCMGKPGVDGRESEGTFKKILSPRKEPPSRHPSMGNQRKQSDTSGKCDKSTGLLVVGESSEC